MAQSITLQTSDSDIVTSDVLGRLSFAASSESSGSDAVLIGASIYAMAESDFTQISNATSIIFATSTSESAIAKLKISSQGHFLPILDKTYDIGASGTKFRNIYAENGKFENISISNLSDPYEILYITDSSGNVSSTDLLKVDLANSELDLNADIVGTGNINISGNLTANSGLLDQIVFNTGLDDPNLTAGQLQWNSTEGTLDLGLNDAYAMHIGEEMLYRVRNVTGTTLLAGQPVYASGLSPGANNRIEVNLYAADGTIREIQFMGLMTEDLTDNGNNGFATWFGYIRGVDTRGNAAVYGTTNKLWSTGEPEWNIGDILYVHPSVPGKLTKIEPKHSISVAIITNVAQNGKIFVRPTSYGHLDDNHDVNVSGATNGQFLQYNSATDYWVPSSSGNFTTLQLNGTTVSVSGHTHTSSDITNFNTAVSGLLPTIANSGDNRILTSTGSTVGINAESNLTFNGSSLTLTGTASFTASTGVPLTITNTGTSNSFVVNDESSDTTPFIIDAAGNVGIGTSSPSNKVHISSAGNVGLRITSTDTNAAELLLYSGSNGGGGIAQSSTSLFLTNLSSGGTIAIGQVGAGNITFSTNGSERVRINSDGEIIARRGTTVGANNIITVGPLDGALGRDSQITFGCTFSNNWGGVDTNTRFAGAIRFGANGGSSDPRDWSMRFLVADASIASDTPRECMRISAAGNIGIGTSSGRVVSGYKFLTINDTSGSYVDLLSNGTRIGELGAEPGSMTLAAVGASIPLILRTNDASRMTISANGNIGIGTSSPSCRLHILDDLAGGQLVVANSETNNTEKYGTFGGVHYTNAEEPVLGMWVQSNVTDNIVGIGGALGTHNAVTQIKFYTTTNNTTLTGTEKVRIDSTGNLYMWTGQIFADNSTSVTAPVYSFDGDANTGIGHPAADTLTISTNELERIRITSNGNVGIGTISPSDKVHISSAGTVALRVTSTDTNGAQLNLYSGSNVGQFAESSTTLFITNFASGGSIAIAQAGAGSITFTTNSQTRLTIASDGKVTTPEVYNTTVGGTNRDLYIDSTGLIGYVSSIRSSKTNIQEINDVNWLNLLKPVSFYYRKKNTDGSYIEDTDGNIDYGLIAEEVESVAPEMCFYDIIDNNPELRGVHYSKLITPMLKYIQQLEQRLKKLEEKEI